MPITGQRKCFVKRATRSRIATADLNTWRRWVVDRSLHTANGFTVYGTMKGPGNKTPVRDARIPGNTRHVRDRIMTGKAFGRGWVRDASSSSGARPRGNSYKAGPLGRLNPESRHHQ
jgi:hypothetical protein